MAIGSSAVKGVFPFGRPNTARPLRHAISPTAQALVVGVYPSAFHVAWTPPADHDPRAHSGRSRPLIASLAVDVEPVVFWDGTQPDPARELDRWKAAVGFDEPSHGSAAVGHNGPSGSGLATNVLAPLGLASDQVAFTDAVPWFFVKRGTGSQGDAIRTRFRPIAEVLGVEGGTLPLRPSPRDLVGIAASPARRAGLRRELAETGAPLVITLGQEALDAVRAVADSSDGLQQVLTPSGYGTVGIVVVDKHRMRLLPLVHPGFQRQTKDARWIAALETWAMQASAHRR